MAAYFFPELFWLIPLLIVVGLCLKGEKPPSKWIPILLVGIGFLMSLLYLFGFLRPTDSAGPYILSAFFHGFFAASVAVGLYASYRLFK